MVERPTRLAQVLQGALDPRVAPGWIVRRHPNDQCSEVCLQARTMAAADTICPFARHQLAVPTQNGVRRHEGCDLREQVATETVSQFGQTTALMILEL